MVNITGAFPDVRKWMVEACRRAYKMPGIIRFGTEGTTIEVFQEGNFTVAVINAQKRYVGYAKCNPTDRFKPEVGVKIAIYRAVRSAIE